MTDTQIATSAGSSAAGKNVTQSQSAWKSVVSPGNLAIAVSLITLQFWTHVVDGFPFYLNNPAGDNAWQRPLALLAIPIAISTVVAVAKLQIWVSMASRAVALPVLWAFGLSNADDRAIGTAELLWVGAFAFGAAYLVFATVNAVTQRYRLNPVLLGIVIVFAIWLAFTLAAIPQMWAEAGS